MNTDKTSEEINEEILELVSRLGKLGVKMPVKITMTCKFGHVYTTTRKNASIDECPECAKYTKDHIAEIIKIRRNSGITFGNKLDEKNTPCCIYFVKVTGHGESFFKIGITQNHPLKRLDHVPYTVELLGCIFSNTLTAKVIENQMHKIHDDHVYAPSVGFNGCSECFSDLDYPEIKKCINNQDKFIKYFLDEYFFK